MSHLGEGRATGRGKIMPLPGVVPGRWIVILAPNPPYVVGKVKTMTIGAETSYTLSPWTSTRVILTLDLLLTSIFDYMRTAARAEGGRRRGRSASPAVELHPGDAGSIVRWVLDHDHLLELRGGQHPHVVLFADEVTMQILSFDTVPRRPLVTGKATMQPARRD